MDGTFVVSARAYGVSGGYGSPNPRNAKKGGIKKVGTQNCGWTEGVARRNERRLQQIDFDGACVQRQRWEIACELYGRDAAGPAPKVDSLLDYVPWAVTLTMPAKDMPRVSAKDFHAWLNRSLVHARRVGVAHYYWIVEFTAAGTPHIHMTIWTHPIVPDAKVVLLAAYWVDMLDEADIKASLKAQDIHRLEPERRGPGDWLMYQAKHASRGVAHYQRAIESMPENWRENSGRMWGHDRGLPLKPELKIVLNNPAWYWMRRRIRAWCLADARRKTDPVKRRRGITAARRMLRCPDPGEVPAARGARARCRGVGVCVPEWVTIQLLDAMPRRLRGEELHWNFRLDCPRTWMDELNKDALDSWPVLRFAWHDTSNIDPVLWPVKPVRQEAKK